MSTLGYDYFREHDLVMTCVHEAGHALYGLLHLMKVHPVQIMEDKKTCQISGLTTFHFPLDSQEIEDPELRREMMKAEISLNYAGLSAERIHFKSVSGSDRFPGSWKNSSSSDTRAAGLLMKKFNLAPPGRKRYLLKKKLIAAVDAELSSYWDDLMIISHGLFQGKNLSFEGLRELLTKRSQDKDYWKARFRDIAEIFDDQSTIEEDYLKSLLL